MTELVFLLEEQSAQAMLEGLLPRLFDVPPVARYIVFEGKHDLERSLTRRIRGYQNPDARFVVIRDQDSDPDCLALKGSLQRMCEVAGRPEALVRVFCRELEAIYLGDLAAVGIALGIIGLDRHQQKARYRHPDSIHAPSKELQRLTNGRYQKVSGSRAIGPILAIDNERSSSFRALVTGIRRIGGQD